MNRALDIHELMAGLKARGTPFVLATVVRTVSVTAAKAGAKAVILADGTTNGGWIGGGCARGAVLKAARQALADGEARLVSIQPGDLLDELGVAPGDEKEGIRFAKNACPSQGTMDIFVEPMLPRPEITICGSSPVAVAIADLGARLGFAITVCAPTAEQGAFADVDHRIEDYALPAHQDGARYIVVSTQGKGDEAALQAALSADSEYVAFVGSRRKAATLREKLGKKGIDPAALGSIHAPAGLDLGSITPEEIALSIVAEIVQTRRKKQPVAGA